MSIKRAMDFGSLLYYVHVKGRRKPFICIELALGRQPYIEPMTLVFFLYLHIRFIRLPFTTCRKTKMNIQWQQIDQSIYFPCMNICALGFSVVCFFFFFFFIFFVYVDNACLPLFTQINQNGRIFSEYWPWAPVTECNIKKMWCVSLAVATESLTWHIWKWAAMTATE